MICAISGETPEEPVVSKKSGHIFEKRVIEKYLRENDGKDPITHEAMSSEDLLPVKVNKAVKPRPPTATSIPGLLHTFQNEWDALMLETYTLKQQLDSVRQELAHALYQHDAATRVIARLIKERDEARSALVQFQSQVGSISPRASQASSEMEVEETTGLPEDVISKVTARAQELSKSRKSKAIPDTLATIEEIKGYSVLGSHNVHSSSPAGVLCVDLHPSHEERVVTGGADSNVVVFNRSTKKVAATASGHSKKVTGVLFHPTQDIILSTSADKTAIVWKKQGSGYTSAHVVKVHSNEVVGCSLHATGDYWATGSTDQTWAFLDIATATSLAQVNVDSPVKCLEFHPDGLLLGTGSADAALKIWDVKTLKNAATFQVDSGIGLVDLAFSENGYYLASASEDNTVKLWDLRKRKVFHTFDLPKDFNLSSVAWDHSGSYLAASGSDIRLFVGKTLNHMATFSGHNGQVTDVKWGKDAHFLASSSMDRSLKFWGKK